MKKKPAINFFLHNEGVIYKSPYSDGKRDAYELSDAYKRDISGATKTLLIIFQILLASRRIMINLYAILPSWKTACMPYALAVC